MARTGGLLSCAPVKTIQDLVPLLGPQAGVDSAGQADSGLPVEVMVTDLPGREPRLALLTTFERHVRDQARLRTRPTSKAR